jgi:predicted glycosyltransferase
MKILIDIGHPAHVHYFRNLINTSKENGYEFVVVARDKEVSQELLRAYEIPFISRGKGASSRLGKFLYMIYANWIVWRIAIKEKPDLFLSVVSPYAAQVSCLVNKPHIALDDTEHATFARKFYLPFSRNVITPVCFTLDLGEKQIRINTIFEFFYLHPSRIVINNKKIDH